MTDDKKPTNLVSIDCAKKPTEEEEILQESIEEMLTHLDMLTEKVMAGEIAHLTALTEETGTGSCGISVSGYPDNAHKMYYQLSRYVPSMYEQMYLAHEYEEGED